MIFVTVGTHEQPFNRLIQKIDELKKDGIINEDVIIQTGFSTYEPKYCQWSKLIPYQQMVKNVADARIVITHGGLAAVSSSFFAALYSAFGKDKLRGVVTIDMSPLPLSPDPKRWTEGTIEELSQVATQVLTSSQGCREFFSEYATGVMIEHKMEPDELEYLLDISGRTPYWICRQLFCDAVFSNYLETAKDIGATLPSLMFIAEHWQGIAKPFVEAQLPGYDTYVMGGHLMFYEYPEKWNRVLENFLNKL